MNLRSAPCPQLRACAGRRTKEILLDMLLAKFEPVPEKAKPSRETLRIKTAHTFKARGQSDMQISTLQKIIAALGGEVEIIARFPKSQIRLSQFHQKNHVRCATRVPKIFSPKLVHRKDAARFVMEVR